LDIPGARADARAPGVYNQYVRIAVIGLGLIGGSLDPNSRADRLAELYDISSRVGDVTLISRLINFHSTLGEQLRRNRALIA